MNVPNHFKININIVKHEANFFQKNYFENVMIEIFYTY